ncbi:hypothetical protein M2138_001485 [Dysgonomonadaceae bacterium PH5-43]|nr:hypothetical protein [Dysgonomonadaceae bacterium PH5-43]
MHTTMKKLFTTLFIFVVLSFMGVYSQSDSTAVDRLAQFIKNIHSFNYNYPQEKVYLHLDNTSYFVGDTIWFKSYVVSADNNTFTDLSKVLYVELLNGRGDVLDNKKLKIENGQAHGEFILNTKEYHSDFYEVRAYTRCMLNFGEAFIYSRVLPVFERPDVTGDYSEMTVDSRAVEQTKTRAKQENRKDLNITFYPEGGNLVKGLRSRVAFKATDKNGANISVTGKVYSMWNEELASFNTEHQGIGSFEINSEDQGFKAKVFYNNKTYDVELPTPLQEGYVMSVGKTDNKELSIKVNKTNNQPQDTLGISIACRGKVYYFNAFISDDYREIVVPESALPTGVNNITLFDKKGEVFAERMVFIVHPQTTKLTIKSKKEIYDPFDLIELTVETKNKEGFTPSNLSLSVKSAVNSLEEYYPDNIYTNLLLSSELKGYIDNPSYYFKGEDDSKPKRERDLDLLMLVNGWRRYEWKRMAGIESFEVTHPIEESLLITGKVLNFRNKKPAKDINLFMWMTQDSLSFRSKAVTDENGGFAFSLDTISLYDKYFLGLHASKKNKTFKSRILLNRLFIPKARLYYSSELDTENRFYLSPKLQDEKSRKASVLEEQLLREVVIRHDKTSKYDGPDIILNVEQDYNDWQDKGENYFYTIDEYLLKKGIPYDIYADKYKNQSIKWCYGDPNNIIRSQRKIFSFYERLAKVDIKEISKIEIYYSDLFAWTKTTAPCSGGELVPLVFFYVSFKDNDIQYLPEGLRHTSFQGYSDVKDFYNPDYKANPPVFGDVDYRRTLYWNPNIDTRYEGKAKIQFYNNSSRSKIIIDCQGIFDGQIVNN